MPDVGASTSHQPTSWWPFCSTFRGIRRSSTPRIKRKKQKNAPKLLVHIYIYRYVYKYIIVYINISSNLGYPPGISSYIQLRVLYRIGYLALDQSSKTLGHTSSCRCDFSSTVRNLSKINKIVHHVRDYSKKIGTYTHHFHMFSSQDSLPRNIISKLWNFWSEKCMVTETIELCSVTRLTQKISKISEISWKIIEFIGY